MMNTTEMPSGKLLFSCSDKIMANFTQLLIGFTSILLIHQYFFNWNQVPSEFKHGCIATKLLLILIGFLKWLLESFLFYIVNFTNIMKLWLY